MSLVNEIKWDNLSSVYKNPELNESIETLEHSLKIVDETIFFSKLVNTSISKNQPFHRWIRYREGYAGDLVKEILKRYPIKSSNEFVLDPMCGSGSTNVACRELNIDSLGLDVNPFAILSSQVKNYQLEPEIINRLNEIKNEVIECFEKKEDLDLNEFDSGISKYFNSKNIHDLAKLKSIINRFKDLEINNFLKLAVLAIVEDCSDRKKDGNGLATRNSPVDSVIYRFKEQCDLMLTDLSISCTNESNTIALCESALRMTEAVQQAKSQFDKDLGAVIFSPPYANSFDYFESYKLELVFGEYTRLENLFDFRNNKLIRNYRLGYKRKLESNFKIVSMLGDEIWQRIPEKEALTGIKDGRTRLIPNMLCAYFEDMHKVIQNCFLNLKKGGMVHIVVDQSAYVGVPIPTDNILALIAVQTGFKVESVIKCRRAATSGQQLKQFPYLNDLLRESIVSIRKV